ncbi:MAG: 3-oxoacyl-[acyl-carrier-protein] reductase [Nitrospirae bacterium]|nr:MAG: 3-oxoacyl-[acyl-carrier-protein] reductase [Nitrospirota bacterium]
MKLLQDKVAIITGGSRGIGKAIVSSFAREGALCAFTYSKSSDEAEKLASEITSRGTKVIHARVDVRDFEGVRAFVDRVKDEFGRLDILVNNAGINRDRSIIMMTPQDWQDVIEIDLTGVFNFTKACIVTFLKQKSGCIINISSVSGLSPLPGQVNYASAKAGVIGLTKALAREVAAYNVRVNAIAPGFIETEMLDSLSEKQRERILEMIPLKRLGTTEEVAQGCVYLASSRASYITGQVITIDGGLSI